MTNFRIEYSHPWLLLLLIPAVALTLLPYFMSAKKYRRTRNRILSIVFHLVAMVLAINLLAGINFSYEVPNNDNEVILLVDASDSNDSEAQVEAKNEFISSVIGICDNQYRLGIVKFGFDQKYVAEIADDSSDAYEKYLTSENPDTSATDLASALKYASTLFTNPKTAKIVVISDGIETDSAATSVIKAIAADGIRVDTIHFPGEEQKEIQLVDVNIPKDDIVLGQEFVTELTFKSNLGAQRQPIKIKVFDNNNDEPMGEAVTELTSEEVTVQVAFAIEKRGMHELKFLFETGADAQNDALKENNFIHTYVNLEVFENILVIERTEGEGKPLADLLDVKYNVVSLSLDQDLAAVPKTVEDMVDFEQIILVNVAYSDMQKMAGFEEALNRYVYDLGGGLFTVGGENDTVGGSPVPHAYNRNDIANSNYFKQMLPVNVIDYTPPIAVMLVIDTSASMSGGRLPAAITGAKTCLDSLNDRDFCGVMSFATRSEEEIQVLPVAQKDYILEIIENVDSADSSASGGTIFSDAISRAGNALSVITNVERKHIIMVTDGNPGDSYDTYLPYIEANVAREISMSVITVGDIDTSLIDKMNDTASAGGGKFYNIKEGEYDRITEYMQMDIALEAVAEIDYSKEFNLKIKDKTGIAAGIDENTIPPLAGYYGTVAKADATVYLMGEYVPIYAQWKYGKGNVGSFMSDLSGLWSDKFMSNEVGQKIIDNIVNSLFPMEDVRINDLEYVLKTDNYTNQLSVHGAKENETVEVTVKPVTKSLLESFDSVSVSTVEANKRYKFVIKDAGLYEITIRKIDENGNKLPEQTVYRTFSYSAEYDSFTSREPLGAELLALLAKDGRGVVLEDPASVFESFSKTLKKEYDPRILFLILCIVLVLLDIAVRKFKFKWPHELVREYKQKQAEKAAKNQ